MSQAHSYQWLGSFGNRGNGRYREELRKGLAAIGQYVKTHQFPQERTLIRFDGQYGNGAVLADVAGFAFVTRGKDYCLLDHPLVQARLHLPPDQVQQRPESQLVRNLYDCPAIPVGPEGTLSRVVVATHPSLGRRRVPLGSHEKASFTNSSSRTCRNTPSPPAMWSSCICIVAPLNRPSPMKTANRTQAAGAVIRPGTRMLADGISMGVEPQIRTGPSAQATATARHRIRACSLGAERTGCHTSDRICFGLWIWSAHHCHVLENGPLHGTRFSSPARWNTALSGRPYTHAKVTTARSRWASAHRVWSQHPQLSSLWAA